MLPATATLLSFNRRVVRCLGALNELCLGPGLPPARAQVLWEVGTEGCDLRSLRARLGLDSGYLSRLFRSLESDGLAVSSSSPSDGRVRTARLTQQGLACLVQLEERSDYLVRSVLAPLDARERERLLGAMAEVERLLTTALVELVETDPDAPAAKHCLGAYYAEMDRRFPEGFDPDAPGGVEGPELRPPRGVLLVAVLEGAPVGCGAVRLHDGWAEVKRLWVDESLRRLGVGRRLLSRLEGWAEQRGSEVARLDTNRTLDEAIAMYRRSGYREIAAYNDNPYAHHWFEKALTPDSVDRAGDPH